MYPSSSVSSSSSSQGSLGGGGGGRLARYGSAPGSLLASGLNAGAGPTRLVPARFFPSEACELSEIGNNRNDDIGSNSANTTIGLRPSYGFCGSSSSSPPSLLPQRSSPAVLVNQLAAAAADKNGGFSITRGGIGDNGGGGSSRLSFNLPESLCRISEESIHENPRIKSENSKYQHAPRSKFDDIDSQLEFCMSHATMGMGGGSMDKLFNIPQDSVPCKVRAKRGCATHPRSLAERERRTRISGKLKKLQDLVPNMDKQTSYADMLDLAVQHIKSLQNQVQKLNKDMENCTCGSSKRH